MTTNEIQDKDMFWLRVAHNWAKTWTGCTKVAVGSVIISKEGDILSFGANRAIPDLCTGPRGCLRIEKHGSNAKEYRGATDCRAIHSEIDAICRNSGDMKGATIYVTRYPCEGCARAIVAAGITKVVFGREQPVSEMTKEIFEYGGVEYYNESNFKEEDTVL